MWFWLQEQPTETKYPHVEEITVYGSTILLGAGGSTLLVTSLSMVADLIGTTVVCIIIIHVHVSDDFFMYTYMLYMYMYIVHVYTSVYNRCNPVRVVAPFLHDIDSLIYIPHTYMYMYMKGFVCKRGDQNYSFVTKVHASA